jgi:NTE family protein
MNDLDLSYLGSRPWLVLGGGGLKGLGHLGAWRALSEAGLEPAGIVGTSIGALVGAAISAGITGPELEEQARSLTKEDILRIRRRVVWVNGIRAESVYLGEPLHRYIRETLGGRDWADLSIPLQVNATSLARGRDVWFGHGARRDLDLTQAIHASSSVPLVYPPVPDGQDLLVDGGTTDALPLRRAKELGCTGLIGVDVGAGEEDDPQEILRQGLVAIHHRTFSIQSGNRRRQEVAEWSDPPLLFIRPRLDGYSTFDFGSLDYFLEEGYRAARSALEGDGPGISGRPGS